MTDILLASCNGEKYIAEQIESILAQTEKDIRLIIQDDCSADGTAAIGRSYAERYPDRIIFRRRETAAGSAMANFTDMLKYASAEHIMFSDQDDVWYPDKVRRTLLKMKELEERAGKDTPLLVHSDLEVVDSRLETLHPSMFRFQGLNGKYRTLGRLYCQNNVTGCTAMINRSLLETAQRGGFSEEMLMHDWWFALIAAAFGEIGFIDEPLVKYRQHGNNQLGAVNNRSPKGIINAVKKQSAMKGRISRTYSQAEAFFRLYGEAMPEEARRISRIYLSVPGKSKAGRIFCLLSHGFVKQNFLAAAGQIIFC